MGAYAFSLFSCRQEANSQTIGQAMSTLCLALRILLPPQLLFFKICGSKFPRHIIVQGQAKANNLGLFSLLFCGLVAGLVFLWLFLSPSPFRCNHSTSTIL